MLDTSGFIVRQIKISHEQYKSIKVYCVTGNFTMKIFYRNMLDHFIHEINQGKIFDYLAGKKNGYRLSIYVEDFLAVKINKLAELHNVTEARIIYTAFVNYINYIKV